MPTDGLHGKTILIVEDEFFIGSDLQQILADTGAETVLPVKGVCVAIGHLPNTAPFKDAADTDDQGYFVPTGHSQVKTKTPGLYVAGDCADHHYRQAITAAGMGCQAAIEAERWLADKEA